MILFFAPGGRLGNLLFQVAYLESIRKPGERVFTINLFGVHRQLVGLRGYRNTDFRPFTRFLDKFITPWLGRFLKTTRLVSTHLEKDAALTVTQGWLPITYVEGYFQRPLDAPVPFGLAEANLRRARQQLEICGDRRPVFLHVRRGDYLNYTVEDGVRPLLDEGYYRQALRHLQKAQPRLHYFLLGDSPEWCAQVFADLEPQTIPTNSPLDDLALMSLCDGGILSNSTFAWWGARLGPGTLPRIAPRYWLGWPVGRWIPRKIMTPWLEYIDDFQ